MINDANQRYWDALSPDCSRADRLKEHINNLKVQKKQLSEDIGAGMMGADLLLPVGCGPVG